MSFNIIYESVISLTGYFYANLHPTKKLKYDRKGIELILLTFRNPKEP